MPKKNGKLIPYRDGGVTDQMSDQMGISKKEAGGLMNKAESMNDAEGYRDGGRAINSISNRDIELLSDAYSDMDRARAKRYRDGGAAYDVTHGSEDVPVEWGRKKLDRGTEQLIKASESQVRGRYFNNNNGKGTF